MGYKRYVIQRLINKDVETNLEVWKNTPISSDNFEDLYNFLTVGYRIFDTISSSVINSNNKNNK